MIPVANKTNVLLLFHLFISLPYVIDYMLSPHHISSGVAYIWHGRGWKDKSFKRSFPYKYFGSRSFLYIEAETLWLSFAILYFEMPGRRQAII